MKQATARTNPSSSSPSSRHHGRRDVTLRNGDPMVTGVTIEKTPNLAATRAPSLPLRQRQGALSRASGESKEFAEIRRGVPRAYVEAALCRDLERGARGIRPPHVADLRIELAADDAHPLGRLRPEVVLAGRDDARGHAATMPLEADALDLAIEVGVVFQHARRRLRSATAPAMASQPRI